MCCGKRIRMDVRRSSRMAPRAVGSNKPTTVLPKEGMTLLGFLGRGSNSRPFYGATYRYEFGGKRHMIANVLDSDVALFLGMTENGKPLFERVRVVKAEKVIAPPVEPSYEPGYNDASDQEQSGVELVTVPTLADLDNIVEPVVATKKIVAKPSKKSTKKKSTDESV